ncbi:Oxygen sensor protein DosP [compost metagenome]
MVAEGVETPEQLDLLRGFGCDQVQGYLISKPLPLTELVEYLSFGSNQQPMLEIVS